MPAAALRVTVLVKQTDRLVAVIKGLITGNTLTVATALAVQVFAPANTEYVVDVLGLTVTVPLGGGLDPELAVQTNGPALPTTDKVADCPEHITVPDGVMLIVGVVVTLIVAVADVVQVPVPDKTV